MIFMDLESLPTHRRTSCSVLVADAFVKWVSELGLWRGISRRKGL